MTICKRSSKSFSKMPQKKTKSCCCPLSSSSNSKYLARTATQITAVKRINLRGRRRRSWNRQRKKIVRHRKLKFLGKRVVVSSHQTTNYKPN